FSLSREYHTNAIPRFDLGKRVTPGLGMHLACQSSTSPTPCYGPKQIQEAYNIDTLLARGINGKGRTIVIIDAAQSPTIRHDLHEFDEMFGLNDPVLKIFAPNGLPPFNTSQERNAGEISLDVEWAHAIAPRATIDLVLAPSLSFADLLSAIQFAVQHNLGSVISMSFGASDTCTPPAILQAEHQVFKEATQKHITLLASAGDSGAAESLCSANGVVVAPGPGVEYPASDPLVTAVGGTALFADTTTGKYISETTWNDQTVPPLATGGGFSVIFQRPEYQEDVPGITQFRGLPDVAYNGDPNTGVIVVCSSCGFGPDFAAPFGGTSAGAPQWAGIVALGDQFAGRRLGFLNDAIYKIGESSKYASNFQDITTGDNTVLVKINGQLIQVNGFPAGAGWDAVTGWGTPDVDELVQLLAKTVRT
ncbi:MAG TPA: S53 family peptidase, partial [Ktedonobacteraceae bacterium]